MEADQQLKTEKAGTSFTYNAERVLGSGSFGIVYQASVAETGDTVAIKKVFQDRRYKNRELSLMKELTHPNVVELKHAFFSPGERRGEQYLNLVMEYCADTIFRVIRAYHKIKSSMPLVFVKLYSYQIFRGLAYIHDRQIAHRDVKPQNILVSGQTAGLHGAGEPHVVKICDFGSAKRLVPGEANVAYICSRYYRAPELIFGATAYTTAVDIWAGCCVTAEMLMGTPLFPGDSGVDQLVEIIKVLGTPSRLQLTAMNPSYTEFKFPRLQPHPWQRVFQSKAGLDSVEFINSLLVYDPTSRPDAFGAMAHEYFDDMRTAGWSLGADKPLPSSLFRWQEGELESAGDSREKLASRQAVEN